MKKIGKILWTDLTVKNAEEISQFYKEVLNWTTVPVKVDDHEDFIMKAGDDTIAGICHKKGRLIKFPNQWLNYFGVKNINETADICVKLKGEIIDGPVEMGGSKIMILKDPQGAVFAVSEV